MPTVGGDRPARPRTSLVHHALSHLARRVRLHHPHRGWISPAGIVAPLPVELIGGTALLDADALRCAGGFVDLSSWASSYSDHLHLSADLTDTGTRLWHCPDPRLGAAHLKWGAVGRTHRSAEDFEQARTADQGRQRFAREPARAVSGPVRLYGNREVQLR